jgi:hypothetical protein
MERKEMLKGVFMVFQKSGYIGTGDKVDVPVTNEKQEPLLPPDVEKSIRERKERIEEIKKDPPAKKQAPLLPPFIKTNKK